MIQFPTLEEALELHEMLFKAFGGEDGVRDLGLLESALYRPQTGYYEDIPQMAAALFESLLINHPFVDGNKRMAFFLADAFLRQNGMRIKTTTATGYRFVLQALSENEGRYLFILGWLRKHIEEV